MKAFKSWQFAAILALAPMTASAQFTTYIEPRKAAEQPAAVVAAADSAATARADTSRPARLTDLKAWVDSAAGVVAQQPRGVVTDTARGAVDRPAQAGPTAAARSTASFQEGAPAPNTATPLPTLLIVGGSMLGAGLLLLRRKRDDSTIECVERSDAS